MGQVSTQNVLILKSLEFFPFGANLTPFWLNLIKTRSSLDSPKIHFDIYDKEDKGMGPGLDL